MLFTTNVNVLMLGLYLCMNGASSTPMVAPPPPCAGGKHFKYQIDSHETNARDGPHVVGDWSCSGTGGTCTMSASETFTVGFTVTVGFSLTLDPEKIAGSAGIDASVAWTNSTGKTQGVGKTCPDGPWHCALDIQPSVTKVSGTQIPLNDDCIPQTSKAQPYTVFFPEKGPDGIQGGNADICACKNYLHWSDNGAPSLVCPQDCKY